MHKLCGSNWKNQLEEYSIKNSNVLIIDSLDVIERLHNRISMLEVVIGLNNIETETELFGISKLIVMYDTRTLLDPNQWGEGLKFFGDCEAFGRRWECEIAQDVSGFQSGWFEQAKTSNCVTRVRESWWDEKKKILKENLQNEKPPPSPGEGERVVKFL
ncbi:Inositol-tetrakisphosphate 1-kinase 1 [Camellia lanceoleosa]|uniref:Inositol-tetrakisphosphate 1-kinase 1 n=1 Tax=Camellia lanceoleosa TaxID=1840588 RepID=A0ACC0G0E5_9ERIC|nr:Inositol-tetrakisphosphate 1-kinase 1 [Camellia lanceoleosa]